MPTPHDLWSQMRGFASAAHEAKSRRAQAEAEHARVLVHMQQGQGLMGGSGGAGSSSGTWNVDVSTSNSSSAPGSGSLLGGWGVWGPPGSFDPANPATWSPSVKTWPTPPQLPQTLPPPNYPLDPGDMANYDYVAPILAVPASGEEWRAAFRAALGNEIKTLALETRDGVRRMFELVRAVTDGRWHDACENVRQMLHLAQHLGRGPKSLIEHLLAHESLADDPA